ncbi:MAG: DEAD/DEAH box helicase family protein [Deltaproteobacteria bacterium]|jgi:type III restriction enzyme|nr:DEAD/DEAH box helicase family protein [Deltaproteobacteria bacterium]
MLVKPYSSQSYSFWSKYIKNILTLRQPQEDSLEHFARLCDILSLTKKPDLTVELAKVNEFYPTLTSFEREFPSLCFALATGIGKTRLMGAMIAYLHYEKNINNFFVMAPNLTIYRKLKSDLSDTSSQKNIQRRWNCHHAPPVPTRCVKSVRALTLKLRVVAIIFFNRVRAKIIVPF